MTHNNLKTIIESFVNEQIDQLAAETPPAIVPVVNVQVALDMDGVLADFQAGTEAGNGKIAKAKATYENLLTNFPNLKNLPEDDIKKQLAGPQTDPGLKALKKALNYYRDQKFVAAGQPGFFLNLPVMPGAKELVSGVTSLTGKKPFVLTAPVDGNSARCEQEKRQWIEKNFPGQFSNFVCSQEKEKYANSNTVLIDDRTKYTNKFTASGGTSILYTSAQQALTDLKNILASRKG